MDRRRGRTTPLSEAEIEKRLWAIPASEKPGEEHELARTMAEKVGELLTVDQALEIADIIYYCLQTNAPERAQKGNSSLLLLILGEMSWS